MSRALHCYSSVWSQAEGLVRIYLYSLMARAFVLMRKGKLTPTIEVLLKLEKLDRGDQVGRSVVRQIVRRLGEELDEEAA